MTSVDGRRPDMFCRCIVLLICGFFFSTALASSSEEYHEHLSLRPLPNGKLIARFAFTTLLRDASPRAPSTLGLEDASQHYTLFPLALGQILREYAITELHLDLNAGKWDYDRWGYPEAPGVGTGGELWAWMGDGASSTIDQRWQGTQNALAGLFCASLGGMDTQRTTSPTRAFPPAGDLPRLSSPHRHALRHATLPAEHVCTENLTPFLKLLPCPARAGVAALLEPHRVFDADWHGLGIHVRWIAGKGVELTLSVQAVFDPVRISHEGKRDWSLRSVFDRAIPRSCPVASSSIVHATFPQNDETYELTPEPYVANEGHALYAIGNYTKNLDIAMHWPHETKFNYPLNSPPSSDFSVLRTLKGASQDRGRVSITLRNHRPYEISLLYLETMPWHVEFYLHTLQVTCNGEPCDGQLTNMTYTPPVPHARPALLQAVVTLPPHTTLRMNMDARKSFLRYTEHPPDAQRGWELPPAVFVPRGGNSANQERHWGGAARVYTPVILIDLATPDFSMPYNVIIMSCTLIALIFGSLFNLLTRKFVVIDVGGEKVSDVRKDALVEGVSQ